APTPPGSIPAADIAPATVTPSWSARSSTSAGSSAPVSSRRPKVGNPNPPTPPVGERHPRHGPLRLHPPPGQLPHREQPADHPERPVIGPTTPDRVQMAPDRHDPTLSRPTLRPGPPGPQVAGGVLVDGEAAGGG